MNLLALIVKKLKGFINPPDLSRAAKVPLNLNGHRGLSGEDIVTLSTQDWTDLWTRKQRFMLQLARQGNKVLFVESQFHFLTYIKRFRSHWRRVYLFLLGPRKVENNLYVFTPPLLLPAFQVIPLIAAINNLVLSFILKAVLSRLRMRDPVLWFYTHYNQPLIKKLGCKKSLYECVDDFTAATGLLRAQVVAKQEAATLRSVDVTIVTSDTLKASKTTARGNIHSVPNAADVVHFGRALEVNTPPPHAISGILRPRLIFLGAIAYWLDLELLRHVARSRAAWQLVMVGPVVTNVAELRHFPNVHFLGRQPYDSLPAFLAHSDVALNPYKRDNVAQACSPLKLYEYIAAGIPVVSTPMPEIRQFNGIITVADSYDDFVTRIESILSWDPRKRREYSIRAFKEAQKHTWESRFLEVEQIVMEALN